MQYNGFIVDHDNTVISQLKLPKCPFISLLITVHRFAPDLHGSKQCCSSAAIYGSSACLYGDKQHLPWPKAVLRFENELLPIPISAS